MAGCYAEPKALLLPIVSNAVLVGQTDSKTRHAMVQQQRLIFGRLQISQTWLEMLVIRASREGRCGKPLIYI